LFVIMQEALARQVGAEAAGFVPQVFCLHDTDAIHKLISDTGFRDVTVAANTRSLPLPAPKDFLWQYVHSTPLAGAVAQLDAGQRNALEHEVVAKWQEFVTDDALMLEVRMVLATARK
ncbi:MAG TPA: hypothetical protein VK972_03585, partial [Wenzhouxiangella sp.]|nr:hypothetical protein [Wenzhouxiangella sp.]